MMVGDDWAAEPLEWYASAWAAPGWGWTSGKWSHDTAGLDRWLYSPKTRRINRALGIE
jgi:hypothetical protein